MTDNNSLKIFESEQFGKIRTVMRDGEPWFVGRDVAEALGYSNTKDAINTHVQEDDRALLLRSEIATFENHILKSVLPATYVRAEIPNRGLTIINESGIYALIFGSRLPKAQEFKHWVTSEVLPSIRKHGAYMAPETIKKVLLNPDTIIRLATALKEEQQKTAKLTAENAELKPKAAFADTVSNSTGALNMSQMAKLLHNKHIDMGRNRLMNFLRNEKILMQDNLPYQQYIERGYFKVIESVVGNEQYPMTKTSTLVLPAGQQFIFNLLEKRGEISA